MLFCIQILPLFPELFEVFDDKKELRLNSDLYIAVLCTYTWSVLQFAFVRTATAETVADHDPLQEKKMEYKNMRGRSVSFVRNVRGPIHVLL